MEYVIIAIGLAIAGPSMFIAGLAAIPYIVGTVLVGVVIYAVGAPGIVMLLLFGNAFAVIYLWTRDAIRWWKRHRTTGAMTSGLTP